VPAGSTLVLVGDLEPAQALSLVEAALAGWTSVDSARVLQTPNPVLGGAVEVADGVAWAAAIHQQRHP